MSYIHYPVISVMGLFLGAFLVEIFGSKNKKVRFGITLVFVTLATVLTYLLIKPVFFDQEIISYWMGGWKPEAGYAIGIGYEIDGLSLFFGLLIVTTFFLSTIYSWRYMEKDHHLGHYYTLFLMLCGAVLGLVFTGDIFNLFIMIEIMTFAAVALTAFRNNREGALEAGFKYLVIGSLGSSFTLAGVAILYLSCHTLNMAQLAALLSEKGLDGLTGFAFALMIAGMGVKSFIVPFHTPAADAYTTAPTSISMVFSGMVNKAGVYGMIRLVYVVFRAMGLSSVQLLLVLFGTVTMFVGVTMALAQHDFKRLLAFHSISQIGYVLTSIGLGTYFGLFGGLFHAMNHTLFKGLLFLTAGAVLYATGTTDLDRLGGLAKRMPRTTAYFLVGAAAISGIPPFNGFASKWMIYQATYEKAVSTGNIAFAFVTVIALLVSVMTLASFIKVTQAVFFGQCPLALTQTKEVPFSMRLPMAILSLLCLAGGIGYNYVMSYVLSPAVHSVSNAVGYVDAMMGSGYATAHKVTMLQSEPAALSVWNPVMWLLLFVVVLTAVTLVALTSEKRRGPVTTGQEQIPDGKYATFFGGEKSEHSHVAGSDLFWGFKKDWKGYFRVAGNLHSGNVNDYAVWTVAATALITLFVMIFIV
ncbi:MAG: hypothetical protein II882_06960 [Lachnospiraceae bacterium]|nr:hypothetical protein [Lachnospiraceae bacterium]